MKEYKGEEGLRGVGGGGGDLIRDECENLYLILCSVGSQLRE